MSDAAVSLLVLGCAIALFVWNRLPVGVVAILTALSLAATGVIDVPTALAGFGDPVVIFIAGLFVVSAGLEDSGVTSWVARALIDKAGTKRTSLLVAVMLLSALLSALITPNGAVAALLPGARACRPPACSSRSRSVAARAHCSRCRAAR